MPATSIGPPSLWAMKQMVDLVFSYARCRRSLSILAVAAFPLWSALLPHHAMAADDVFQWAVNYVFTGTIDPAEQPEIVDRKSCVVVVSEPRSNRYARFYLSRFKMDTSRISKRYVGARVLYELEVEGDDNIVEYLKLDKKTVEYGLRSSHISLPGSIDQTEKALQLIFSDYCKTDKPKSPF